MPLWSSTGISSGTSVDPLLHGYEPGLPDAMDLLEQATPIDLVTWLRILVPYVAGIFVRGHDFISRFMNRPVVEAAGEFNTVDNANGARFIEFERMLAPVCCARWVVLHKNFGESFVLNDLGVTGTFDKITGERGWVLPIGKSSVLGVFPRRSARWRTMKKASGGRLSSTGRWMVLRQRRSTRRWPILLLRL